MHTMLQRLVFRQQLADTTPAFTPQMRMQALLADIAPTCGWSIEETSDIFGEPFTADDVDAIFRAYGRLVGFDRRDPHAMKLLVAGARAVHPVKAM